MAEEDPNYVKNILLSKNPGITFFKCDPDHLGEYYIVETIPHCGAQGSVILCISDRDYDEDEYYLLYSLTVSENPKNVYIINR